ncbi:hypothetical protein Q3G72_019436 [Acer saccharum]|nr:hypothetical protein Q3G72_019436 [Acer saccharum]
MRFSHVTDNGIISLKNLQFLGLRNVSIHDGSTLLQSLGSLPYLKKLDLSYNNFNGNIMSTRELHNITNLEELTMRGASFHASLFQSIAAFTSLETLDMSDCQLNGIIGTKGTRLGEGRSPHHRRQMETKIHLRWSPVFAPNGVVASPFTGIKWSIVLFGVVYRVVLSLPGFSEVVEIHFRGVESALCRIGQREKNLGAEKRVGVMCESLVMMLKNKEDFDDVEYWVMIDLSNLKNLKYLSMDVTNLNISFLRNIGPLTSLESLSLEGCNLDSTLPDQGHLAEGCFSLLLLALSNNSLQGQIFSANFNLTNLVSLQLDGNNFSGKIPDSLSNTSYLRGLYLSDNQLSGKIPGWLGNMSRLIELVMPNNHLEGPIPPEFRNMIQGELQDSFRNSSSMVTLDLGYNSINGSIPNWIGRLFSLTYLILNNNNLQGRVPIQLCQLDWLRLIDLSHNNLFEDIPHCLMTALHDRDFVVPPQSYYESRINETGDPLMGKEKIVEFRTKTISYFYQGKILTKMSGIDLSCNKLTGDIPPQSYYDTTMVDLGSCDADNISLITLLHALSEKITSSEEVPSEEYCMWVFCPWSGERRSTTDMELVDLFRSFVDHKERKIVFDVENKPYIPLSPEYSFNIPNPPINDFNLNLGFSDFANNDFKYEGDDDVPDAISVGSDVVSVGSVGSDSEEVVEVDDAREDGGVGRVGDEHGVDDEMNEVHGALAVPVVEEEDVSVNLELMERYQSKSDDEYFSESEDEKPEAKIARLMKGNSFKKMVQQCILHYNNTKNGFYGGLQAFHWYCARHIYANFRKTYSIKKLKDLFWEASRAYDRHVFKRVMADIGVASVGAKAWLEEIEPKHWSRHVFEPSIKCDHVTNNMIEAFNSLLGEYRVRTYLSLLEYIRRLVMTRFQQRKEDCSRWKSEFPPTVNKKIMKASLGSRVLKMIHAGEGEYEMLDLTGAYTAKLRDATCECGQWQISGVPCSHTLAGIKNFYGMGGAKERLINFIHPSLSKSAFETTYRSMIHPILDLSTWADIDVQPVIPPPMKKKVGRLKLFRKREFGEKQKAARHESVICAKCKQAGHNKWTCKGVETSRCNKWMPPLHSQHKVVVPPLLSLSLWFIPNNSPK